MHHPAGGGGGGGGQQPGRIEIVMQYFARTHTASGTALTWLLLPPVSAM